MPPGKVLSGILRLAQNNGVKIGLLCGRLLLSEAELKESGILSAVACANEVIEEREALEHADELIHQAINELFQQIF